MTADELKRAVRALLPLSFDDARTNSHLREVYAAIAEVYATRDDLHEALKTLTAACEEHECSPCEVCLARPAGSADAAIAASHEVGP